MQMEIILEETKDRLGGMAPIGYRGVIDAEEGNELRLSSVEDKHTYVIYDTVAKTVRYRRLVYDIAGAQQRIRDAGLPERLATRLALGQ